MNRFTLLAFVATAFAGEKCANAADLHRANFEEYKIKYYSDKKDLTKVMSIGFDVNDVNCKDHCWYLQTKIDTTFKIKGDPELKGHGFLIYSEDEKQLLSLDPDAGFGFYMYGVNAEHLKDDIFTYSFMNYDDDENRLSQAQKTLGVNDNRNETHIFQAGFYGGFGRNVEKTKFCFIKVGGLFKAVQKGAKIFANAGQKLVEESVKENHPEVYNAVKNPKTWTENFKDLAWGVAKDQVNVLVTKAVQIGGTKLKEQLVSKLTGQDILRSHQSERRENYEELREQNQQSQFHSSDNRGPPAQFQSQSHSSDNRGPPAQFQSQSHSSDNRGPPAQLKYYEVPSPPPPAPFQAALQLSENKTDQNELLQSQEQQRQHDQNPKKVEKESKALLQEQQQQQPQFQQTQQQPQQQRTQEQQEQQKDNIPPNKKDAGSSVQTPFALCSLALLLFVTY